MLALLDQLGSLLHWEADDVIADFWAYVDDSNIHDRKTGRPTRIGHGGAIATFERWKNLENEWNTVMGDTVFHMTDFEAYRPPFDIKETEHKALLNKLLTIIKANVLAYVGCSMTDTEGNQFLERHKASVVRMLNFCHQEAKDRGKQKIHLVFGKHPEVSNIRIQKFLTDAAILFPYVESFTGTTPQASKSLQAADLLAYEFVRWERPPMPFNARYPIQFLYHGSVQTFHVFHS